MPSVYLFRVEDSHASFGEVVVGEDAEKTGPVAGMAGCPAVLKDFEDERIAIAVEAHFANVLGMTTRLPFDR